MFGTSRDPLRQPAAPDFEKLMARLLPGSLILALLFVSAPVAAQPSPGDSAAPAPDAAPAAPVLAGELPDGLLSPHGTGDEAPGLEHGEEAPAAGDPAAAQPLEPGQDPAGPAVPPELTAGLADAAPADAEPADAAPAEAALADEEQAARELVELKQVEAAAIDEEAHHAIGLLRALGQTGVASPLYGSLDSALDLSRPLPLVPTPIELGAEALADVAGFDLERARRNFDIPVEMHPLVAEYIRFFQGRGRKHYLRWLGRASRYQPMIRRTLAEAGLPQDTVFLAMIESGFSPVVRSSAKATGLWQFMEPTGRRFGLQVDFWVDERRDPVKSTVAAAAYLKALYAEFGDWRLAWAGYNAGEGKVRRAIREEGSRDFWDMVEGRVLRPETKHYVPKLMAAALITKNLAAFGFSPEEIDAHPPLEYDEAEVPEATDLAVIARAAGVTEGEIKELNTQLRRWCTPPSRGKDDVYRIRLPAGTRARFAESYAKIAPTERLTYRVHRIARGDTLSQISHSYGTEIEAIMRLNRIKDARRLRLGDTLIIPVPQPSGRASRQARTASREPAAPVRPAPARAANASSPPRLAKAGSGRGVHTVAAGESLWSIARRYDVHVDELVRWNGLGSRRQTLRVGQRLKVHAGTAARPAPPRSRSAVPAVHVVAAGETLWSVARQYGVSVEDLERWNGIGRPGSLRVGERLTVSAP